MDTDGERAIADQIACYPACAGRVMRAIKVSHRPPELEARLRSLGWNAHLEAVRGGVFWGEATPV